MIDVDAIAVKHASELFGLGAPSPAVRELAAYKHIRAALEEFDSHLAPKVLALVERAGLMDAVTAEARGLAPDPVGRADGLSCKWPQCTCERECPQEAVG